MLRRAIPPFKYISYPRFQSVRPITSGPVPLIDIPDDNFYEFVFKNANQFSERTAFVDGITGDSVRYSEVTTLTGNVASALVKKKFEHGDVFSIITDRCIESLLVLYGVSSTGGVINMINSSSSVQEIAFLLRQTRPRFILTSSSLFETVAKAVRNIGSIESIYTVGDRFSGGKPVNELLEDDGKANPRHGVTINNEEDIALLPHSSGITGLPKTVKLTHSNLLSGITGAEPFICFKPENETVLACHPFHNIYSLNAVFSAGLRAGVKFIILPKLAPDSFLKTIENYKVTYLPIVAPIGSFLCEHPLINDFNLSSIERIVNAGTALSSELHGWITERFRKLRKDFNLIQGYGLTEMSPGIAMTPPPLYRKDGKEGSVGAVLPNTRVRVVNVDTGNDVEPGEVGEIIAKGPQMMRGYLNDPISTAETIRKGWLHTGDLGTYDEDGYLYVTDRIKDLLKYKGNQVAPAELEDILMTHSNVLHCAVVGKHDSRDGDLPTAFVVRTGDVTEDQLKRLVAERVNPNKHLHGGVIFVDSLPVSPTGKVVRRVLREKLNK